MTAPKSWHLDLSITLPCGCVIRHAMHYMRPNIIPGDISCTLGILELRAKKRVEQHNAQGCKLFMASEEARLCSD